MENERDCFLKHKVSYKVFVWGHYRCRSNVKGSYSRSVLTHFHSLTPNIVTDILNVTWIFNVLVTIKGHTSLSFKIVSVTHLIMYF